MLLGDQDWRRRRWRVDIALRDHDRLGTARLFVTADGEADKRLGNETIRWDPTNGWLELRLPSPLAHLANCSRGRYRIEGVAFPYRGDEVAAQTVAGRYVTTSAMTP
jgi:hypothetical protein